MLSDNIVSGLGDFFTTRNEFWNLIVVKLNSSVDLLPLNWAAVSTVIIIIMSFIGVSWIVLSSISGC